MKVDAVKCDKQGSMYTLHMYITREISCSWPFFVSHPEGFLQLPWCYLGSCENQQSQSCFSWLQVLHLSFCTVTCQILYRPVSLTKACIWSRLLVTRNSASLSNASFLTPRPNYPARFMFKFTLFPIFMFQSPVMIILFWCVINFFQTFSWTFSVSSSASVVGT